MASASATHASLVFFRRQAAAAARRKSVRVADEPRRVLGHAGGREPLGAVSSEASHAASAAPSPSFSARSATNIVPPARSSRGANPVPSRRTASAQAATAVAMDAARAAARATSSVGLPRSSTRAAARRARSRASLAVAFARI